MRATSSTRLGTHPAPAIPTAIPIGHDLAGAECAATPLAPLPSPATLTKTPLTASLAGAESPETALEADLAPVLCTRISVGCSFVAKNKPPRCSHGSVSRPRCAWNELKTRLPASTQHRRLTEPWLHRAASFNVACFTPLPESRRLGGIIAGGANPRLSRSMRQAPTGRRNSARLPISVAPPGLMRVGERYSGGYAALHTPATFLRPFRDSCCLKISFFRNPE